PRPEQPGPQKHQPADRFVIDERLPVVGRARVENRGEGPDEALQLAAKKTRHGPGADVAEQDATRLVRAQGAERRAGVVAEARQVLPPTCDRLSRHGLLLSPWPAACRLFLLFPAQVLHALFRLLLGLVRLGQQPLVIQLPPPLLRLLGRLALPEN